MAEAAFGEAQEPMPRTSCSIAELVPEENASLPLLPLSFIARDSSCFARVARLQQGAFRRRSLLFPWQVNSRFPTCTCLLTFFSCRKAVNVNQHECCSNCQTYFPA